MIQHCNAEINAQLLEVTTLFSSVHEDLLLTAPLPAKWSAKQCLEHLNLTLALYLPRIKEALKNAEPSSNVNLKRGVIGSKMISRLEKDNQAASKIRPVKTFKSLRPHVSGKSCIDVVLEFSVALKELSGYIDSSLEKNIDQLKITSAVGPLLKLKLGDVYPFLLHHNRRHIIQAQQAVALCKRHKSNR